MALLPETGDLGYLAAVIVPAHNEARTLARLLEPLVRAEVEAEAGDRLEIIVVCNGCTDDTAGVARRVDADILVVEVPEPSKQRALRVGDQHAATFPRVYVDADVEIDRASIRALVAPLHAGPVLATAPERRIPLAGCPLAVRWYYDIWQRLPQVRDGLFGRGVVALSAEGNERFRALPQVMSDDLAMSEAFAPFERAVVPGAHVVVHPPRRVRDLVGRRVRVATGNAQADETGLRGSTARTSVRTLAGIAMREPSMAIRMPVFLWITLVARVRARRAIRRGDFETWRRDESSRR